ncbi:2-hydroxyacid dehydrogenase [Microbulbifer bruguierae]|uniref:2-hydroxyacid dehydrogenase n=1 Tax=Microbulbifer bruguierae TaxID=3029061 RepID=A0ABY8NAE0_9GAMM|nr:2-hydroxyacid dehydrogenase [Microbulbifer bruguierae]WGL15394.1 2-hydroxyacid dehydrogenase [Microbulbifer bruguierae]
MKIALFSALKCERTAFDSINQELGHEILYFEELFGAATVELAEGCDGVCVSVNDGVDGAAIVALKEIGCRILVTRSIGFNQIDLDAADKAGIPVARVPHYSPHSVSEFTVGLILSLTRKIHRAFLRSREFNFSIEGLTGTQLSDKTVGVLGAGQIGGLVLKALSGFGCRLLYHDLHRQPELDDIATCCEVPELTRESDILVLNLPLTPDTRHTINASSVPQLKPGVLIINTGRGGLIDTGALVEGLKSGHIGGAAIDVYEDEANLFHADRSADILQDDTFCRLLTFPNVIVTSHMAFLTDHALADIATTTLQAFTDFEQGRPLATRIER